MCVTAFTEGLREGDPETKIFCSTYVDYILAQTICIFCKHEAKEFTPDTC